MVKKSRKHCTELAKKIARTRDKLCLKCGKGPELAQMQGSHIKGTGAYPNLSYNPRNIKCLCAECHRWWHSAPTESGLWFAEKYPEWHKEIQEMAKQPVGKHDYNEIYADLLAYYKKLI